MGILIVILMLGGLGLLVWVLTQEEDSEGSTPRVGLRDRWAPRGNRGRWRVRFEESLDVTVFDPPVPEGPALPGIAETERRGSRALTLVELVLLIIVVGAVFASVLLGAGRFVTRAITSYLGG